MKRTMDCGKFDVILYNYLFLELCVIISDMNVGV
jgi:hypothetical protein